VRERRQFGVAIGSFQAVKHRLADATLALEFAAPAVLQAAWSAATGAPTRARDVSMAYVLASEAATGAAGAAVQCHGAMGYTVEYDLHLYAKRAWALAADGDGVDAHLSRVAEAIGVEP
jgi:alkylation response protein AidB-like acyl-CoA dehydrogenase